MYFNASFIQVRRGFSHQLEGQGRNPSSRLFRDQGKNFHFDGVMESFEDLSFAAIEISTYLNFLISSAS